MRAADCKNWRKAPKGIFDKIKGRLGVLFQCFAEIFQCIGWCLVQCGCDLTGKDFLCIPEEILVAHVDLLTGSS